MKRVMDHIRSRSEQFAQQPMFEYLRDETIPAEQRLCFMPMMAHYVFSFMDINKYILRNESIDTPFQRLVNIHSYEDATHWPWWVADMRTARLDKSCTLTAAMRFVWSDATRRTRLLTYEIISLLARAKPVQVLAIVETIESTGYEFLAAAAGACNALDDNYLYYGKHHSDVESGHHMGTEGAVGYLETIELSDDDLRETLVIVDRLYHAYTEFVAEMYDWVQNHDQAELAVTPFFHERPSNKVSRPLSPEQLVELRSPVANARPSHASESEAEPAAAAS
jgi:hypothetical protein